MFWHQIAGWTTLAAPASSSMLARETMTKGGPPMEISCREVIQEISNYIEDDLEYGLRERITEHLKGCHHCTAVLDGARNLIQLVCDDRTFVLPAGFGQRLYKKLNQELSRE
jgi:hypothetical protein